MGHVVRAFQGVSVVTEIGPFDSLQEAKDEAQDLADMMGEDTRVFVEDEDEVIAALEHQLDVPEYAYFDSDFRQGRSDFERVANPGHEDEDPTAEVGYELEVTAPTEQEAEDLAAKLRAGIETSADICQITPSVCVGNLGIPRSDMPQFDDPAKRFLQSLQEDRGIAVEDTEMAVGELRATQREINARKVFGMLESLRSGLFPAIRNHIIVSNDGYILDGHHRWATLLVDEPGNNMKVFKVDMPIYELLIAANASPGVTNRGFGDVRQNPHCKNNPGHGYPVRDQMINEIWEAKGGSTGHFDSRSEPGERLGWMVGPQLSGELFGNHTTMVVYADGLTDSQLQRMYDFFVRKQRGTPRPLQPSSIVGTPPGEQYGHRRFEYKENPHCKNPGHGDQKIWIGGIPEGETGVLMGDLPEPAPFPKRGETIDQLRWIVDNGQAHKIDGVRIDLTTANVVVQVYDALSPANQEKYGREPIMRMVDIAWKLARRNNPHCKNPSIDSSLSDKEYEDQFEAKYGVRPGDRFKRKGLDLAEWIVDYTDTNVTEPPIVRIFRADLQETDMPVAVRTLLDPNFFVPLGRRDNPHCKNPQHGYRGGLSEDNIGEKFEVTKKAEIAALDGGVYRLVRGDVIQMVELGILFGKDAPIFELIKVDAYDPESEYEPDAEGIGIIGYFHPNIDETRKRKTGDYNPAKGYIRPFDYKRRIPGGGGLDSYNFRIVENPGHDWIQDVDEEIEAKGTEGAFTKQARRAGYKDTMEFARAVMRGWRSGKRKVFNKKTRRLQGITEKTMDRANFAINVQKRRK